MDNKKIIHFDKAASTQPDEKMIDLIAAVQKLWWNNPSSVYESGQRVRENIDEFREGIIEYLHGDPNKDKLVFCASGSEANNLGVNVNDSYCVIVDYLSHPSLFNNPNKIHCRITNNKGKIDLELLENELKQTNKKPLVAISYINSEIGSINDIKSISKLVHKYNGLLLVDACQAINHTYINVESLEIDMLTFTSEKMNLPRGCGCLYIKNEIELNPIVYGGGQEYGLRAGTENQAMIYAIAAHLYDIKDYIADIMLHEVRLRELIEKEIDKVCKKLNQEYTYTLPHSCTIENIISIRFKGIKGSDLLTMLDIYGVEVSLGSACSAGNPKPSRILKGIGLSDEEALSTIRISFDWMNTEEEIIEFGKRLEKCLIGLKM